MIPAQFEYTRPSSLNEAVGILEADEDAKVIAGGQSLLPLLRLRFAYPSTLVDLGAVESLRSVRDAGRSIEIGAMVTHYELTRDPLVAVEAGLLAEAAGTIADPAVRHRGTIGGALSHADPAGDLPAVITALDADLLIIGPSGKREVKPAEFFSDYLTTTLAPGEILAAIRVPKLNGWGYRYEKFHVTAQAWAVVGVAALVRRQNGQVADARVGLTNMGSVPVRASGVEAAATGADASVSALAAAAAHADEGTSPPEDLRAAADYRRHLARVLTGRALAAAAGL
ncbi:MAG: xanthine dehydrogenase family protein subunit M [Nocardiopsaceae bacterium]|nr:xanthine dehydrogenase family protein subunit M [Nocardiopsaceae bacterium]